MRVSFVEYCQTRVCPLRHVEYSYQCTFEACRCEVVRPYACEACRVLDLSKVCIVCEVVRPYACEACRVLDLSNVCIACEVVRLSDLRQLTCLQTQNCVL